jgi:hypothetical protein
MTLEDVLPDFQGLPRRRVELNDGSRLRHQGQYIYS